MSGKCCVDSQKSYVMLPKRKREIPMGEAGNLSVFPFTISIISHSKCWLAHIGGGVEHLFYEDPQEVYILFTFQFSENYGTFVLYTAEWICADSKM